MTDEHRAKEAPLKASIRLGNLTTKCADFALQFHAYQYRDGTPRPLCVCGSMPSLVLKWEGSGYPTLLQSLS